jgi:hypothetical protein
LSLRNGSARHSNKRRQQQLGSEVHDFAFRQAGRLKPEHISDELRFFLLIKMHTQHQIEKFYSVASVSRRPSCR